MKLIQCGTKAHISSAKIDAIITGISIRFNRSTYELSYFYNGEYKSVWLDESEFETSSSEKLKIGFKN